MRTAVYNPVNVSVVNGSGNIFGFLFPVIILI